jgi:hypothetical protein
LVPLRGGKTSHSCKVRQVSDAEFTDCGTLRQFAARIINVRCLRITTLQSSRSGGKVEVRCNVAENCVERQSRRRYTSII